MAVLGGGGNGGLWNWKWEINNNKRKIEKKRRSRKASESSDLREVSDFNFNYKFPLKQAVTAASLALTGDTIAQFTQRFRDAKASVSSRENSNSDNDNNENKNLAQAFFSEHDWLRAFRMTSYGFLLYGPGSYGWYQYLDRCMPEQTARNLIIKVILNQIVLGPCVIAVVFAWNNLWQGKILQLPAKYQKDALPTLFYGYRFWIPVSLLNFWVVPLQARVAFMSMGSIFWNFCLSSTMSK